MPLNLRDFLAALGSDLIRIEDEVDPVTQAGALFSAAPRPLMLVRLRRLPGLRRRRILVKGRPPQAAARGTTPRKGVGDLSDPMFSRGPRQWEGRRRRPRSAG